jgi:hypothetical protein
MAQRILKLPASFSVKTQKKICPIVDHICPVSGCNNEQFLATMKPRWILYKNWVRPFEIEGPCSQAKSIPYVQGGR